MWPFKPKPKERPKKPYNPEVFGSLIICVGQPGTGKTWTGVQLALISAYKNGLSFIAQDPNGEVVKLHAAIVKGTHDMRKREFLLNPKRVRILAREDTDYLDALMERLATEAKSGYVKEPRYVLFVDEAGIFRLGDETFWQCARRFRNLGITCYTTQHRAVDIPPAAREVTRAVILWKPYEDSVEFFGKKVMADDLPAPLQQELKYIDSFNRELRSFTMRNIPNVLTDPSQPSDPGEIAL